MGSPRFTQVRECLSRARAGGGVFALDQMPFPALAPSYLEWTGEEGGGRRAWIWKSRRRLRPFEAKRTCWRLPGLWSRTPPGVTAISPNGPLMQRWKSSPHCSATSPKWRKLHIAAVEARGERMRGRPLDPATSQWRPFQPISTRRKSARPGSHRIGRSQSRCAARRGLCLL